MNNYGLGLIDALYAMDSNAFSGLQKFKIKTKEKTKCLLLSCNKLTNHNSGYCSKECKAENQFKLRGK